MDAFLEFLSENAQRRYPLSEDVPSVLADGILLDVRGFSRASPSPAPALYAYSGENSTGDTALNAPAGHSSLFLRLGKDCLARVDIPTDTVNFPITVRATVDDPHTLAPLGGVEVTIGQAWLDLDPDVRTVFGETAPFETGVVVDLYRQQVDEVRILHRTAEQESIEGDLTIRGGYHIQATQFDDQIRLDAAAGNGELGYNAGDGPGDLCRNLIYTINGVRPNTAGNLRFLAGSGIEVINLDHKIQIRLKTEGLTPLGSCL